VQGDEADCMYIVEDGEVSIVMRSRVRIYVSYFTIVYRDLSTVLIF